MTLAWRLIPTNCFKQPQKMSDAAGQRSLLNLDETIVSRNKHLAIILNVSVDQKVYQAQHRPRVIEVTRASHIMFFDPG